MITSGLISTLIATTHGHGNPEIMINPTIPTMIMSGLISALIAKIHGNPKVLFWFGVGFVIPLIGCVLAFFLTRNTFSCALMKDGEMDDCKNSD